MDIEQFDYADVHFTSYSKGSFFYEGNHEGYKIQAEFRPAAILKISLSAVENFKNVGWARVIITDPAGKTVYTS